MTADEKLRLAHLLDTTGDYLRDGFRLPRAEYGFTDDGELPPEASAPNAAVPDAVSVPGSSDTLDGIAAEIGACTGCALQGERKNAVPGEGAARPLVMIIGEGPGADEDASGRPFVGKAGQLLDKMLASVGLSREKNCFIANVVKCRPPNNRDPLPEEMGPCSRFLARQITLLNPKIILCVGRISAQALLKTGASMGSLRGSFKPYQLTDDLVIPLLSTYHPSAILRDESYKRPSWEDLKLLRQRLMELDSNYALEAGEGGR
ncbi:uracil-DNA glycosylase [Treponema primitia]|uniref:uracil-DNA glycosylase n=1 Tax=Treponema primitia TaxID=88058 RepID=UPI00397EBB27